MWLALKRTVCFLRRVGNHSRRAAKDAASRNEFAYRLAPFKLRWMRSLLTRVAQSRHIPRMLPRKHLSGLATLQQGTHDVVHTMPLLLEVGWGAPTANHTSDDRHDHHHSHVRQSTDCPGDFDDVTGETLRTCRHS